MKLLDGRQIAARIREETRARIARQKVTPGLAIVQVGDNPESTLYVKLKERAANDLGIHFEKHLLPEDAAEAAVLATLAALNEQPEIHGIVVQLPLPPALDTEKILSAVALEKDVDGLHPAFQRAVQRGVRTRWLPALQQSILTLLGESGVSYRGKTALLLAKSAEFRATLGAILKKRGCRIVEAPFKDGATQYLQTADIIVTALGTPRALHEEELKPGAVLIDAGLTKLGDGSVAGDFFGAAEPSRLTAVSPVPGGIGPVTVATLLHNTLLACEQATRRSFLAIRVAPTMLLWLIPGLAFSVALFFSGSTDVWGRAILFLALPIASLLWWIIEPRRIRGTWWKNPDVWYAAFLAVAALSTILSPAPKRSLEEFSLLLLAGLTFLLGRGVTQEGRTRFAALLVFGAVLLSLWSVWMFLTQTGADGRIKGPFNSPDGLGAALLLPLLFSLGLMRSAARRWQRVCAGVAAVILAGTLAGAAAMSSYVGLAVALCVALFAFRLYRKQIVLGLLVVLLVGWSLAVLVRSTTNATHGASRVTGFAQGSATETVQQWSRLARTSFAIMKDAPVFGVGLGLWGDFFPRYQQQSPERIENAHGTLLQYASELGTIGLLFFLALLTAVVFALRRGYQHSEQSPLVSYGLAGLLALAVAGCIDTPWLSPALVLEFWFCVGMFLAPITEPVVARRSAVTLRAGVTIAVLALLGYGLVRMITTYYVSAAETSGAQASGYIDALATSDLAMRLWPTPNEELRMTYLLYTKSLVPGYREQLIDWVERTVADDPHQPVGYLISGLVKQYRGDTAAAEALFQKGLEQDQYFTPDLAVQLGSMYLDEQRYADARDLAVAQIERTGLAVPGRAKSLSSLSLIEARAELALGERDAANASLQQALDYSPENTAAQALLQQEFTSK